MAEDKDKREWSNDELSKFFYDYLTTNRGTFESNFGKKVEFASLDEVLFAVRIISEGRLGSETNEGLETALQVLNQEQKNRISNPAESLQRLEELNKLSLVYSLKAIDATDEGEKDRLKRDIFAVMLAGTNLDIAIQILDTELNSPHSGGLDRRDRDFD